MTVTNVKCLEPEEKDVRSSIMLKTAKCFTKELSSPKALTTFHPLAAAYTRTPWPSVHKPDARSSTQLSPTRLQSYTFPPTRGSHSRSDQCPLSSGECPRLLRFCSDPRTHHGKHQKPALADVNRRGFVEMVLGRS